MSHVVLLLRSTALWRGDVDAAAQSRWSGGVVSRTITARTVAVRDTILAVLRSEWPLPISTGDVLLGMAGTVAVATARCKPMASASSSRDRAVAHGAGTALCMPSCVHSPD